jgi:hypothetical protein
MSVALAGALGGVAEPDALSEILPDGRIGAAAMMPRIQRIDGSMPGATV